MSTYQLQKLNHAKNSLHPETGHPIGKNQFVEGMLVLAPKIGSRCLVDNAKEGIYTSAIKHLVTIGDETTADQLVLPEGFPKEELEGLKTQLFDGDTLFVTHNSLYLLRKLP